MPADLATVRRMQSQKRRDTKPELQLRRELHRRGYRYYIDRAPLPALRRRADLVFPRLKVAVFVDGCFWHACLQHGTTPKNNHEWWVAKLAGNTRRDCEIDRVLSEAGWTIVRIWEHEQVASAVTRVEVGLAEASQGSERR